MTVPTPKAFHPIMPDELGKWSSLFTKFSLHYSFEDICRATRGPCKLPVCALLDAFKNGGAPVHFAPDTWSGTNQAVEKKAPAEAMQFGGALHRLLYAIVDADPSHGLVHMAKVDLLGAYMRVRLLLADLPQLAFVVPPHSYSWATSNLLPSSVLQPKTPKTWSTILGALPLSRPRTPRSLHQAAARLNAPMPHTRLASPRRTRVH
jgi:hypothetical protein